MSDPKDKLPPEAGSADSVFGGVNEDEWLAAVDEWDSKLDLPAAPQAPTPAPPSATLAPAPTPTTASAPPVARREPPAMDPLVQLVTGDIEIPEDEGEALGSLLGSAPPGVAPPEQPIRPPFPVTPHRPPTYAPPLEPVPMPGPTDDEVFAGTEGVWEEMATPAPESEFGAPQASIDRTVTASVDEALLLETARPASPASSGGFGAEGATRIVTVDDGLLKQAARREEPLPRPAPPPVLDDFYDGIEIEAAPPGDAELPAMLSAAPPLPAAALPELRGPEPEPQLDGRGREGEKTPVPGTLPAPPAAPPPEEADLVFLPPDEEAIGAEEPEIEELTEPGEVPLEAAPPVGEAPLEPPVIEAEAELPPAPFEPPVIEAEAELPSAPPELALELEAEPGPAPEPAPALETGPPPEPAPSAYELEAEPPDEEQIFGEVDQLLGQPVSPPAAAPGRGAPSREPALESSLEPSLEIVEPAVEAELEAEFPEALGLAAPAAPAAPTAAPAILAALAGEGEPEPPPPPALPAFALQPEALALPDELPPGAGEPFDEQYWRQQEELLVAELHLAQDPTRAAALAHAAAGICERRLGDPARALELLEHAHGGDPQHGPTLRALRRLNARRGDWDAALAALQQEAGRVTGEERTALLAWQGDIQLGRGDAAAARAAWAQLLEARPGDLRARLALCDLAASGEGADELIAAIDAAAGGAESRLAAELRLEQARLHEALGHDEDARRCYRAVIEIDPSRTGALMGLWRTALRAGVHEETALYEARLAELLPALAAPLRRHEAELRLWRLKDPIAARAAAEATVALAPDDPAALATLATVLTGADDAAAALTFDRLAVVETDPGRRAAAHLQAAELRESRLADAVSAAASVERALEAAPDLVPAQLALERLSAKGDPERQLAIARGAALTDPGRAPYLRLLSARLLSRTLNRPDEATAELALALQAAPAYPAALREQVRLLTEAGRHHEAATCFDQAALAVEEERPAEAGVLREMAAAMAGRGPDGEAGEAEERARLDALCAGDAPAALRWARLAAHLATGGHTALGASLAAEAESAVESARGAALWHLRARLLEAESPAEALESERQALALVAHHAGAHFALWRRAAAAGPAADAAELLRSRAVAVAARARVQSSGGSEAPPESAALLLRAGLALEGEDPSQAAAALDEVLALQPGLRQAREALLRVARATGDAARAASLLAAEVEDCEEPDQRFALLLALADAHALAGDATRAAERAKQALELRPGHPLAVSALQALYLQSRNFAALAEFSFEDLKRVESVAEKVAAYERLAEIDAEQRGDVHSAILGYETVVDLDPAHAPTLRTLERYYLTQERWADLVTTYGRLARATQAAYPELCAELNLERARLVETRLQAAEGQAETPPPATLEMFRAAGQAQPRSLRALRRIDLAAREGHDVESRIDVTLRLADALVEDARAAAVYLTRAAELSAGVGRPDEALRLFADATARLPDYLSAWRGLRLLTVAREDWTQLAAAAEGEGGALRDSAQRAAALLLAGFVAQEKLADPARAAADFRRVLEAEPSNDEAFARLRGLLAAREEWPELAALLKQRTEIDIEPARLTELHFSLAEVLRDHLGDRTQAKAQLKLALHHTPQSPRSLAALSDMHWDDGEWAEAADVLIRRLRVERERGVLKEILFRLGLIYADKLPDVKRAVAAFSRVLQVEPENRDALRHLADLHLKDRNWKEAHTATARLAALEPETERKVHHMLRLARIVDEGFRDLRRATEMYRKALEVDPYSLPAIAEFARFYERQNDQRSAHVHLDTAITRFRMLLQQDPFDVRAYGALFQIFGWRGDPDRAHTAAQILGALGGTDERVLAYLQQVGPTVAVAGGALAEPMIDDILFPASVPAGFRHLFRLLDEGLGKVYKSDLKPYNLRREERLPRAAHPIREIANAIAEALRLGEFDVWISSAQPNALALENTDPPSLILGANLVKNASQAELRFALGRLLKLQQLKLALPSRLSPNDLGLLVSGIVRQFVPDFAPAAYSEAAVIAETSRAGKAVPRKMHQEVMPFALECAGAINWDALVMDLVHVGNRAGLLQCGSLGAALTVLRRAAGHGEALSTPADFARTCRGNRQIEEMLRFAVSQEYLELRRQLGIALG